MEVLEHPLRVGGHLGHQNDQQFHHNPEISETNIKLFLMPISFFVLIQPKKDNLPRRPKLYAISFGFPSTKAPKSVLLPMLISMSQSACYS